MLQIVHAAVLPFIVNLLLVSLKCNSRPWGTVRHDGIKHGRELWGGEVPAHLCLQRKV